MVKNIYYKVLLIVSIFVFFPCLFMYSRIHETKTYPAPQIKSRLIHMSKKQVQKITLIDLNKKLVQNVTLIPAKQKVTRNKIVQNAMTVRSWPVWKENTSTDDLGASLKDIKNNYQALNKYNVTLIWKNLSTKLSQQELLCELKTRVPLVMIKAGDGPVKGGDWQKYLPTKDLNKKFENLKRCAIVSSAGSLKNAKLGAEIDDHDAVMRFNAAPTDGYSTDVGEKTSIRIINSQLVYDEQHHFLTDPLYQTGVLILWDPAPYKQDLQHTNQGERSSVSSDDDLFAVSPEPRSLEPIQPAPPVAELSTPRQLQSAMFTTPTFCAQMSASQQPARSPVCPLPQLHKTLRLHPEDAEGGTFIAPVNLRLIQQFLSIWIQRMFHSQDRLLP